MRSSASPSPHAQRRQGTLSDPRPADAHGTGRSRASARSAASGPLIDRYASDCGHDPGDTVMLLIEVEVPQTGSPKFPYPWGGWSACRRLAQGGPFDAPAARQGVVEGTRVNAHMGGR